jgi:hypothetical protein
MYNGFKTNLHVYSLSHIIDANCDPIQQLKQYAKELGVDNQNLNSLNKNNLKQASFIYS